MAQEIDEMLSPAHNCEEILDDNKERLGEIPLKLRAYSYSMKELELLRFANVNYQKRKWKEIYQSLDSDVVKEYDGLRAPNNQQKKKKQKKTKKRAEAAASKLMKEMLHMDLNNGVRVEKVDDLENGVSKTLDTNGWMTKGKRENREGWSYSRSEMEALRFVNVGEQGRWWEEVYHNLDSDIVGEFDGLWVLNDRKQQQSTGKTRDPSKYCGDSLSVNTVKDPDVLNDFGDAFNSNRNGTDVHGPLDENENFNDEYESSSDEYESIQRPAFFVEGEPDFESGPPLDGLEYLRRVRWEAAQIPKVKVVKLNSTILTNEQTAYMPSIPEISKCPSKLLPSKDWENAFLADFAELRQAISALENSCDEQSLRNVGKVPGKQSDSLQQLKKNAPTLTAVLGMDAVCRAAALRNSITLLEPANTLSRDECLWLFALCAAVDTPLHADTSASLRCLLRKCSSLLALKLEPDDEVAMLNILITITGRYFGQFDNS